MSPEGTPSEPYTLNTGCILSASLSLSLSLALWSRHFAIDRKALSRWERRASKVRALSLFLSFHIHATNTHTHAMRHNIDALRRRLRAVQSRRWNCTRWTPPTRSRYPHALSPCPSRTSHINSHTTRNIRKRINQYLHFCECYAFCYSKQRMAVGF
jgi:hypothetical protein